MPSSKNKTKTKKAKVAAKTANLNNRQLFITIVGISLLMWILYRSLFNFSVFFDETIGKAMFMGLPIWMYLSIVKEKRLIKSGIFNLTKIGLLKGLFYSGIFGFTAIIFAYLQGKSDVVKVNLFLSDHFWWEFFLSMLTAFWESIFFFGFVQSIIKFEFKDLDMVQRVLMTSMIFLLFHVPNSILRFSGVAIGQQIWLMMMFALGQSLVFEVEKNIYTLILIHSFWGMVLLIHF